MAAQTLENTSAGRKTLKINFLFFCCAKIFKVFAETVTSRKEANYNSDAVTLIMLKNKTIKMLLFMNLFVYFTLCQTNLFAKEVSFTLEDRDRLIRIETTLANMKDYIDKRFEQVDKRFEQVDKRFEQVDKRFEFQQQLTLATLGVFGTLSISFVGLLLWDRRTFKEKAKEEAKEEAVKTVEHGKLKDVISALREIAVSDNRIAEALRKFNLL